MVMVPAQAGGRMGGCETTPPDSRTDPRKPAPPSTASHNPAGFPRLRSSPAARRHQARSSSPLRGCGGSSLTRGRAAGTNQQLRGNPANSQPGDYQVTGSGQHALFDSEGPHGWMIGAASDARSCRIATVAVLHIHTDRGRLCACICAAWRAVAMVATCLALTCEGEAPGSGAALPGLLWQGVSAGEKF